MTSNGIRTLDLALLITYILLTGLVSVTLAPLSSFWWIFPLCATALLLAILLGARGRSTGKDPVTMARIVRILHQSSTITPAQLASSTGMSLKDSRSVLESLVGEGVLVRSENDSDLYLRAYYPANETLENRVKPQYLPEAPPAAGQTQNQDLLEPLSERELEILSLMASGHTNSEIARELYVAVGTVKSHVNNIYRKLGARNRVEALSRARELGLIR